MKIFDILERTNRIPFIVVGFAAVPFIGWVDYATGYELTLSIFYLLPIGLVAWVGRGRALALGVALWAVATQTSANVAAGQLYSRPLILYWNSVMRLGIFVIVALLIAQLRELLDYERRLSRSDPLTGLANRRVFHELLAAEVARCRRYHRPFTLVYLDLDNFKQVNDERGHDEGDRVLRTTALSLTSSLRASDLVARLGGDEFALLLSECGGAEARRVVDKARTVLVREMKSNDWPVTVSIGVYTCLTSTRDADDLLSATDNLMYSAKRGGKDGAAYATDA